MEDIVRAYVVGRAGNLFNPEIARKMNNDINASILLHALLELWLRGKNAFNSSEMEQITALSNKQQGRASKVLQELGLAEVKFSKKLHAKAFALDVDAIATLILAIAKEKSPASTLPLGKYPNESTRPKGKYSLDSTRPKGKYSVEKREEPRNNLQESQEVVSDSQTFEADKLKLNSLSLKQEKNTKDLKHHVLAKQEHDAASPQEAAGEKRRVSPDYAPVDEPRLPDFPGGKRGRLSAKALDPDVYADVLRQIGYPKWLLEDLDKPDGVLPTVCQAVGKRNGKFSSVAEAMDFLEAVLRLHTEFGMDGFEATEYILNRAEFYAQKNAEAREKSGQSYVTIMRMSSFISGLAKPENVARFRVFREKGQKRRNGGAVIQKSLPTAEKIRADLLKSGVKPVVYSAEEVDQWPGI